MESAPEKQVPPQQQTYGVSKIDFNFQYPISLQGILRILQLLFGLLCWTLSADISPSSDPHVYIMVVGVTSWIFSAVLFVLHLFGFTITKFGSLPWPLIEVVFNGTCAVLYFVAACVSAAYTYRISQLIAATVFAFLTTIAYIAHAFLSFLEYRGTPVGMSSDGVRVNA